MKTKNNTTEYTAKQARFASFFKDKFLIPIEYFKSHITEACESYPTDDYDEVEYEYFLGFEVDDDTNLWTVFARVLVNRETKECIFLDYKTPDGVRMENPIKPTSFA